MGLDVRLPIGLMFTIIGLLLAGFGFFSPGEGERGAKLNINLWWGLALVAFGVVMLLLARRGTSAMQPTSRSVEGQAIERAEHSSGIES
jgi:hypothetical protein